MTARGWVTRAATLIVLSVLASCSVSEDPEDVAAARVLADGRVEIDLSDPPTRADLAVPDGRKTFSLEGPDKLPYEVVVTFTNGDTLDIPDSVLVATTNGSDDPTRLVVMRHGITLGTVEQLLRDTADHQGVDPAEIDSFLRSARTAEERETTVNRVLSASEIGPEKLEVQPIAHGFDGRYQLNYLIEWED